MRIEAQVPVRLVNGANAREHWAERARRAKWERKAATTALITQSIRWIGYLAGAESVTITITRRGGRRMDDDGLTISAKHVRDGIADWLGIDDGDKRLTWIVKQDKAPRGKHWVDVVVTNGERDE